MRKPDRGFLCGDLSGGGNARQQQRAGDRPFVGFAELAGDPGSFVERLFDRSNERGPAARCSEPARIEQQLNDFLEIRICHAET